MSKQTADAANAAVSNEQPADGALATTQPGGAMAAAAQVNISPELRDKLSEQLQKTLHAIETGFDTLTKPSDIEKEGEAFWIVDGLLIEDFVDKRSGEETAKCIFRLQYEDGRVVNVMQSAARPRKLLAEACELSRQLGGAFKAGPYKYVKKGVGQIQDAIIFEQQAGWRQEVY